MLIRCKMWFRILTLFYVIVVLESTKSWGNKQLFPSSKIPDDALNPRRAVVRRKIVLYHNFFRSKVRPTASNMLLMSWHPGAAKLAQKYADKCIYLQHNDPKENAVRDLGNCGQNLFASSQKTPWFFVMKSWFLEYRNFTYGTPIHNLKDVGHYTQMVWATSHKVGCGVSLCRGGPWGQFYNYVCHYCPGGNYDNIVQYPYRVGAPCADCPKHCSSNALCTNSCPKTDTFSNCKELKQSINVCKYIDQCKATCMCENKRLYKNYPWD